MVLTSSVFEADEGVGPEPRRHSRPYGLSKTMTSAAFRSGANRLSVPLGRFVIPNPFGPFEEPRFCDYLVRTWRAGAVPAVRTPRSTCATNPRGRWRVPTRSSPVRWAPTRARASWPRAVTSSLRAASRAASQPRCPPASTASMTVALGDQTEFDEPAIRINSDLIATICKDWSEAAAWDEVAE